ncbi:MAG: DUF6036 family nucleotidyltransferase [Gemmatimonadota bacterium]|nr:DUF6036 family nucleotidyltransferase [Gemmatimonadota bacterium]
MLSATRIRELFDLLNGRLSDEDVIGELYLVGGAVMSLAFAARPSTNDVDALFVPKETIRRLARKVAVDAGVSESWLNDAAKGFLGDRGEFSPWLELSHLRVFIPVPEYLLAMKCIAFRLGPEFRDEEDVRYLLRYLNLERAEDALAIVERYFPADRIPPKTRFALQEILG